ncbi:putative glycerol-3-phosphate acyltransferase [mine drainage metagenome]|uniref:Putative glycerol-3-phosphate acyltransferase n=1 Tax=mine drainage metagenome TaxID=410659 RepID=A0A1J5RHR8_9ZZZZ
MNLLYPMLAALAAYLLGSIAFAIVVSRALGLSDPRSFGSGNPGATNVLRSGSKLAAVLTLLLDAAKGWLPVWLATLAQARGELDAAAVPLVALAVFLGHLYPVFFGFRGGKGVATAAGVLLAINPWLGLATLATWLIVALFTRYSSAAALAAAAFAPLYFWFGSGVAWPASPRLLAAVVAIALLIVWRHRGNIVKLLAGTESRIGRRS